jgi:hypothetical protein
MDWSTLLDATGNHPGHQQPSHQQPGHNGSGHGGLRHGELRTQDGLITLTPAQAQTAGLNFLANGAKLRIIATDPAGHARAVTTNTYRPPDWLIDLIRTRDGHCRFPGCTRPADVCDLDHTVPYQHGGPTNQANMACLCRRHHRMKTHSKWQTHLHPDGTLTWTAPTGHTYTTEPATYP